MENNPVLEQIELIDKLIAIGRLQEKDVENIGHSIALPDEAENIKLWAIINTKKIYIGNFFNLAEFLKQKLKNESDKNFKFYLPLLRTFFDLYAELLYLCNENGNKQGGICVAQSLFILANRKRYSWGNQSNIQLVELYNNYFNYCKSFIDKYSLDIPQNIDDFSGKKLEKLGLNFPNTEEIYKQQYFKDCCVETQKLFKFEYDEFYYNYRWLSDYVHGEIYSTLKIEAKRINEKFWIIVKIIILSLLIIELVNKKILDNAQEQEFKNWIKDFQSKSKNFIKYWKNKKTYDSNQNPTI
ncbi:hypothetical protein KAI56_01405 [Candidatus Parcubacteria bacterium]|nr:hypothetical protein [Candidatus Parcubacteria bacterium]